MNGTVTFINSPFTGNEATAGGAVNVEGGTVTFTGGTFTGNSATGNGATGNGGAVNVGGGTVTFTGGTFTGNSATANGGALYLKVLPTFTENENLKFSNNSAGNGGAIDSAVSLSLDDKFIFEKNTANNISNDTSGQGGAVRAGTLTVTGGSYIGNTAYGTGGALFGTNSVTVSGGTFRDNGKTEGTGAATTNNGGAVGSKGPVNVSGGTFENNEATNNGGAVIAEGASTIRGGTFENNTAGGSGGAFYGNNSVTITGGEFTHNTAKAPSSVGKSGGGAVYAAGKITGLIPDGSSITFENNEATLASGGALLSEADIELKNAIFKSNKAAENGGAIYSVGKSTLTNSVFGVDMSTRNIAGDNGGAVNCGTLESNKNTFLYNSASGQGGAILVRGTGDNSINESLFAHNSSVVQGGAILCANGNATMTIEKSVFDANGTTGVTGGALCFPNGTDAKLFLNRCTFTANFVQNTSSPKGGAAYIDVKDFQVINCTFYDNAATGGQGAALYLTNTVNNNDRPIKSVLLYCTFVNNRVGDGQGGALYSQAQRIKIAASVFLGNVGQVGSDIFRGAGTLYSDGYNFIDSNGYGILDSGVPGPYVWEIDVKGLTREDKLSTRLSVFGSNVPANDPPSSGTAVWAGAYITGANMDKREALRTIALVTESPAMDLIPKGPADILFTTYLDDSPIDERGERRPLPYPKTPEEEKIAKADSGAYESGHGIFPPDPDPDGKVIDHVKMSEIPNTMVRIGQTCSLTALVYYSGITEPPSFSEPVTWASSKPNVARIDQYGNLVSLTQGMTVISVTTQKRGYDNEYKTDAHELTVSEEWGSDYDNNIHPDVWRRLGLFNDSLQTQAVQLSLRDFNPALIAGEPFAGAFKSAYGVAPAQVTDISDSMIRFDSASFYPSGTPLKPSVSLTLNEAPAFGGGVLPIRVIYGLSWDEVSSLLGRKVTKIDDANSLFGKLNLVFTDRYGKSSVLVDNGREGISASGASGKALSLNNGNNGLSLIFDVFLSDANAAGDGKPRLIDNRYLTAADGAADGSVAGSLWLLKIAGPDDGGDSSGGGGGCSGGFGLAALSLAAIFVLRGKHRS
ncbi:MAG: Ig-like domain-containing protein [Synergistaceae bacterium]|nr:Ig-like domain-containing protein [Synergistaceae bacterium]